MPRARILIVDDDSDFSAIVKTALESRGYEAIACGAPDDCERLMRELSPDLLILDLMMGGRMEGALIARRLKGNGGRRIPILMLTGVRRETGFFWLGDPRHPVYLPVEEVLEKPVKPAELAQKVELLLARGAGQAAGPRRTLVVIDDNPALRGACMEVLLRAREYVVAAAQDGPSGLELVESCRPDAALVDLLMPGMDGAEVIRRLQESHPALPVIGITGDGLAASAAEKRLRRRIRWLLKPFTPVELREAVRRAIEEPEGIA